jgi:hypothetical protein
MPWAFKLQAVQGQYYDTATSKPLFQLRKPLRHFRNALLVMFHSRCVTDERKKLGLKIHMCGEQKGLAVVIDLFMYSAI